MDVLRTKLNKIIGKYITEIIISDVGVYLNIMYICAMVKPNGTSMFFLMDRLHNICIYTYISRINYNIGTQ